MARESWELWHDDWYDQEEGKGYYVDDVEAFKRERPEEWQKEEQKVINEVIQAIQGLRS